MLITWLDTSAWRLRVVCASLVVVVTHVSARDGVALYCARKRLYVADSVRALAVVEAEETCLGLRGGCSNKPGTPLGWPALL